MTARSSRWRATRERRGTAVVAALALVMLAAALLASAATVASAGSEAVLRARASLVADAGVRRALARSLAEWQPASDALPPGGARAVVLPPNGDESAGESLPVVQRLRVQRLTPSLFALTVDVQVGGPVSLARRRATLLVQRQVVLGAEQGATPPVPIARWSMADLY